MYYYYYWLFVSLLIFDAVAAAASSSSYKKRVCVIGAGPGGLAVAKYLQEQDLDFTVLEARRDIATSWQFNPRTGLDDDGLPTSHVYKNLRIISLKHNLVVMDYPVPDEYPSYPSWQDYSKYLQSFADHFNLRQYIKLSHKVTSVKRVSDTWKVRYSVRGGPVTEEEYDYVIVATGHYNKPVYPKIPGQEVFKGTIIHSTDYREPERYQDRRVLVIGGRYSAFSIGADLSYCTKSLYHSNHKSMERNTTMYPSNYFMKPDVKRFTEHGVEFVDGTYADIDDVLYCTGYDFDFSFLDASCGLNITSKSVSPLHQNIVNINQPTMMFLGLTLRANTAFIASVQARYAAALVKGNFTLPPKEQMLKEWQRKYDNIVSKNLRPLHLHISQEKSELQYFWDLSEESGIYKVPAWFEAMDDLSSELENENFYTFRDYKFTLYENGTFSAIKGKSTANVGCNNYDLFNKDKFKL